MSYQIISGHDYRAAGLDVLLYDPHGGYLYIPHDILDGFPDSAVHIRGCTIRHARNKLFHHKLSIISH